MTIKQDIAYWLLGTDREEIRKQFRRVEDEIEQRPTELKQLQGLLGIDWWRKPESYNVEAREKNYLYPGGSK